MRRYQVAAVRVAYKDVLQREPTSDELDGRPISRSFVAQDVIGLYAQLLLSTEFINRYVLDMSPLLLARMIINQLYGRSPISFEEIGALASRLIEIGFLALIHDVLTNSEVRARIFGDVQRLAQYGTWEQEMNAHVGLPIVEPTALAPSAKLPLPRLWSNRKLVPRRNSANDVVRQNKPVGNRPVWKVEMPAVVNASKASLKATRGEKMRS